MQQKYTPATKNIPKIIMNRRYKKLQELINNDEYFSEEQIRMRDVKIIYKLVKQPLLYFIFVGQYIRNGNNKPENNFNLSDILMEQLQRHEYEMTLQTAYDKLQNNHDYPDLMIEAKIKDQDLEDHEDILIRLMHQRFLHGLDGDFIDYQNIDENENYDDLKQIDQDLEEEYFEQVKEEEFKSSEYTGIQDY